MQNLIDFDEILADNKISFSFNLLMTEILILTGLQKKLLVRPRIIMPQFLGSLPKMTYHVLSTDY